MVFCYNAKKLSFNMGYLMINNPFIMGMFQEIQYPSKWVYFSILNTHIRIDLVYSRPPRAQTITKPPPPQPSPNIGTALSRDLSYTQLNPHLSIRPTGYFVYLNSNKWIIHWLQPPYSTASCSQLVKEKHFGCSQRL